jgi:hypothetical protein
LWPIFSDKSGNVACYDWILEEVFVGHTVQWALPEQLAYYCLHVAADAECLVERDHIVDLFNLAQQLNVILSSERGLADNHFVKNGSDGPEIGACIVFLVT